MSGDAESVLSASAALSGPPDATAGASRPAAPAPAGGSRRGIRPGANTQRMLHASPAIASLLVLLAALGASVTRSPDAASAWREAERSVEWMLVPGERMLAGTRVVRRHWGDHFRATHGVLVATDRRLLYAGVLPRSLLGTSDGPPLIERIAVPLDTLLEVSEPPSLPGGWERLTIRHGETTARFSVAAAAHDRALAVVAIATRARDMAAARAARELFLQDSLSALPPPPPMMHVVRAGETVIGIAARYGLSPEELMERNGLASDRVRAGQRLTVREFRRVGSMVEAY